MSEAATPPSPVAPTNLAFVDEAQIVRYLDCLFEGVEWTPDRWLNIRGIGEKGTKAEGVFREDKFYRPIDFGVQERILETARRYAVNNIAMFCTPAVLKEPRGRAEDVELFTNLLVDFDTGDTDAKLKFLEFHLGPATMVIASGGKTDEGRDKIHVYYKLATPTDDIGFAVRLREAIAKKTGGDHQFGLGVPNNPYGRAHQPVRIAGSCHSKKYNARAVTILSISPHSLYSPEGIGEAISAMPYADWVVERGEDQALSFADEPGGHNGTASRTLFDPEKHTGRNGEPGDRLGATLTQKVYEGGEAVTRYGEFNKVAGHYIRMAREGRMTVEEALAATQGWVLAQMVPPWPPGRADMEFWKLHNLDCTRNGAMPIQTASLSAQEAPGATIIDVPATGPSSADVAPPAGDANPTALLGWAAHRWMAGEVPKHAFLVDKMIIRGEPHIFVAEGGAGKTGLILDLGMKIAAYDAATAHGMELTWCGQKVVGGGRVVLLLNEDSKTELHIRAKSIDQTNLIGAAGDNLIVLPMSNLGGSFPLVERDPKTGTSQSSRRWNQLMAELRAQGPCAAVVIDTFNSVAHGDENSSVVIAEMVREARRVCHELNAALIMAHHLRKAGNEPIRSLAELKDAVRGSSAIEGAFRIVLGMFKANDYDRRMKAMGLTPVKNALWRFGIAKANIVGLITGEKTLLRGAHGILEDRTDEDKFNAVNTAERAAWLILAIKVAAQLGHPYSNGGKTALSGLYKRRAELPMILRKVGASEFSILVENALQDGRLVLSARGSKEKKWLDDPNGDIAMDTVDAHIDQGAYTPPDFGEYVYVPRDTIVMHKSQYVEPFQNGIPTLPATVPEPIAGAVWSQAMRDAADERKAPEPPRRDHMKGAVDD